MLVPPVQCQEINVLTYNIRFNNAADGINAWPNRVQMVTGLLRFHDVEVFGMQEALKDQIADICKALPSFKFIGAGRDDGKEAGEFSPIFFDTTKFTLRRWGWFWLSETPDKPGKGWDAMFNRICTWVELQPKNGNPFMVFNTHLDHQGKIARVESAKLIMKKIQELNLVQIPVILMGDFNSNPESETIQYILQLMNDSRSKSIQPPYGPEGTFNGFEFCKPIAERIDYIFVSDKVKVIKYAVLSDSNNNRYPSDHLPVYVKISL
jgi:endonuclease/exonuclease/phosphatase family metal-dependent hydrolase